jgi:hypothetical protein
MPIQSNTLLRDTANLVGPGTTLADDGYGNLEAGPTTDVVKQANIKVGLFPMSTVHDWIRKLGGGPENTRDWQVALPGRYEVVTGYAFVVPAGANPGTYRVKQVTRGPTRASLTLCICNREK